MKTVRKNLKTTVIAVLVGFVTVLHYSTLHGHLGLHIIHRELYFIPILLSCFWFGLKPGLMTSLLISFIYAPHVFLYQDAHGSFLTVAIQILMFILVAVLIGWLVDRQQREHLKAISNENLIVLGRAAALIGHEMNDLLNALKTSVKPSEKHSRVNADKDFYLEMSRLETMVDVLSSFAPSDPNHLIARNLNTIIQEQVGHYSEAAKRKGVKLATDLDEKGCPVKVDTGKLGWILGHLIQNALEFSDRGTSIMIRSIRRGDICLIKVHDQGPGIKPEHLVKMFTPFFTTRIEGFGLSLAASKKILNEIGGDIRVESKQGSGATFTIIVPREAADQSDLAADALAAASQVS